MRSINDAGIRSLPFNEAKGNLSSFMSDVVRKHVLTVLHRGRVDREALLAIGVADLLPALAHCQFDARVNFEDNGSVIARLPQFGLVAVGEDFDGAIDALHGELLDYCDDFFSDFDYYRHTDRVEHLLQLLRFALTDDDKRKALLSEEPDRTPARTEGALALAH